LNGGHFLDERQIALVADKGQVVDFLDSCRGPDMIEMSMGGQQGRQFAAGILYRGQQSGGFLAWVDKDRFVSFRTLSRQQNRIHLQGSDRQDFQFPIHG
jgi:hypothetical protein